jgi:hypothetical protein
MLETSTAATSPVQREAMVSLALRRRLALIPGA